jgi:uncharacterized OB-fold protein
MVLSGGDEGRAVSDAESFERVEPPLTERTEAFWTSGADGVLRIAGCGSCGRYQHPPRPVCSRCHSRDIAPVAVLGRGTVWSWTVNRYQWQRAMPAPYVVAEVELTEQPGLRLLTNIVDCEPEEVRIGMAVEVCFARSGDAFIPLFRPVAP